MKTITVELLKKDIEEGTFTESTKCPMTKALNRAGYGDYKDVVGMYRKDIKGGKKIKTSSEYKIAIELLSKMELNKKGHKEYDKPKDFTVTFQADI